MARVLQVQLSIAFQELVQDAPGQSFNTRVNENYNTIGLPFASGSKDDVYSSTTVLPGGGSFTLNVANLAPVALDYLFAKTDQPLTVQMGAADEVPMNAILVKDGALPAGVTSITFRNPGTVPANLTYCALGH